MCGIAGAFDLRGQRCFPEERILAMTGALSHRGPDDEQVFLDEGLALGVRRLSVIDIAGGRQPLSNENGQIWVAYEGELFDYPEVRGRLLARGHNLKTNCDTEAWVHLYEDHGEQVFNHAHGQFGVSLWDREKRILLLGRDRLGIAPLFYTEANGWLLWASEIKALLASGLVDPQPDRKGLDYFFNFFAHGNSRTSFQGIKSIVPGHYLKIMSGRVDHHQYWDFDFPDAGHERRFATTEDAVDEFEALMRSAIRQRLAGETPLCCYISGGLDSTTILGLSTQEREEPIPSFTIGLDRCGPSDERTQAAESASLLGSPLVTVNMQSKDIVDTFPELIQAAEGPVFDTSAACMIRLAKSVRRHGYTVSLTGEGSDELLAGYIWFKAHQLVLMTGKPINNCLRSLLLSGMVGRGNSHRPPYRGIAGIRTAQQFTYEMMGHSREWLYSDSMWKSLGDYCAYDELGFDGGRMKRWHPLNQSLYVASKVMLPGMLLSAKGDRSMRNGSTEGRFPFLDERVIDFCTQIDPRLKLRGWSDKRLLRRLAERVLPPAIAGRRKTMFRANLSTMFVQPGRPNWVDELLSPKSLEKSGYFDPQGVQEARQIQLNKPKTSFQRFVLDMGLIGVISTQLWHHIYMGGGLADLPSWSPPTRSVSTPPGVTFYEAVSGGI